MFLTVQLALTPRLANVDSSSSSLASTPLVASLRREFSWLAESENALAPKVKLVATTAHEESFILQSESSGAYNRALFFTHAGKLADLKEQSKPQIQQHGKDSILRSLRRAHIMLIHFRYCGFKCTSHEKPY